MKSVVLTVVALAFLLLTQCIEANSDQSDMTAENTNSEAVATDAQGANLNTTADSLKIIIAFGGEGEKVDWNKIEQEELDQEEAGDEGPGYFYNDCAQGIEVIEISSQLSNKGNSNYGKEQLTDDDPNTAWVEGKSDYGIGEYFVTKGFCPNTIYNGYQNSPSNWKNNSRVKRFKIYVNNEPYAYLDLTDEMGAQIFNGPSGDYDGIDEYKFEIVEVYQGEKWSDVAISHIDFVACCFGLETEISSFNKSLSKENIKEGDNIRTVDIETGKVSEAHVQKISTEKHINLVDLITENHSIKVTKNHPLYFEGIGFISIENMRKKLSKADHMHASDYPRILTLDKNSNELVYEKIISCTDLNEAIETYTIRKVSDHSNYIANGFVCRPY